MSSSEQIVARAGKAVLDDDQLDEVVSLGCGEPLPRGDQPPVHELVAGFARTNPTDTAVESGGGAVSYRELDVWTRQIAARLGAAGIGRGNHVGLLAEPSTAMVAAVLGILRCGAAYVPVDQAHPDQRIAEVLADAYVRAVVVTGGTRSRLTDSGLPLIRAEDADDAVDAAALPEILVTAGDAAYLIYTSGSTGEPKGVLVEHGHLAASTLARRRVYPGAPVFLLVSPLAFDSSVAGLWGTLTAGGRLVVATSDEAHDPERLVELIERHQVTRLLCVPALYGLLLDAAKRLGAHRLGTLDTVVVAGETLPEMVVRRHFTVHAESVTLVNEYGPTETTVWASYHRFDAPGPVSIGRPVPGVRLYVLDDHLRPVPRGSEGELVVGGAGVSCGYFGRPADTARVFVGDPFAGTDGARMYRTGDIVRWNADGTLDFLGRCDHQVKICGHRVELGAVEAHLRAAPGIRDAVVVPDSAGTKLTGFVITEPDVAVELVRDQLAYKLPSVMVPTRILVRESFPVTVNGKVDRTAMRAVADDEQRTRATPAVTAGTARNTVARVAAAWAEVLKMSEVPTEVNFFDLGGHSFAMFQLQDALESHTGIRPSVVALFRHTTVSAQAALIREAAVTSKDEPVLAGRQAAVRRALAARARRQRAERETAK